MTRPHDIWPSGILERDEPDRWWRADAPEEVGRGPFILARQLADLVDHPDARQRSSLEAVIVASLVAGQQGSSRTPLDAARLVEILTPITRSEDEARELAEGGISALGAPHTAPIVGRSGAYRPLIVDGEWLYHQRLLRYEDQLVAALTERLDEPFLEWPEGDLDAALDDFDRHPTRLPDGTPMRLSPEQRYAILTALHSRLSIITGGPGTGKTSIVVSLLRIFSRLGVSPADVALAAPTGKAAHRMGESIKIQLTTLEEPAPADVRLLEQLGTPRTLHRLLEYSPSRGTFRRSGDFPIDARIVVIDEASMIDLVLMERLAAAVPTSSHLVLLGDAEQLPSVETGTVLRDLIPQETSTQTPWARRIDELPDLDGDERTARHAVRLTTSYRMSADNPAGAAVLQVAEAVRRGDADEAVAAFAERDFDGGVHFVDIEHDELRARRADLREFVDAWFEREFRTTPHLERLVAGAPFELVDGRFTTEDRGVIADIFEHVQRARLLCLTRVWATGADAINAIFHGQLARQQGFEAIAPDFLPGDLVLMQRNDYERGLFNGDQGLILRVEIEADVRAMAVFPEGNRFRAHHLPALRGQLDHAFAMTVHKAQGSEFDEVAVILPEEEIPLLTRELLYTGITRCRRRAFIVGDETIFRTAVARPIARFTGVRDKLGRP